MDCMGLSGSGASLFIIVRNAGMQLKLICRRPKVASHTSFTKYNIMLPFPYLTPYIAVQADPFGRFMFLTYIISSAETEVVYNGIRQFT